jgi:hypothetical protein
VAGRLAGNVRIFGELNPEWEVDPRQLVFLEKVRVADDLALMEVVLRGRG